MRKINISYYSIYYFIIITFTNLKYIHISRNDYLYIYICIFFKEKNIRFVKLLHFMYPNDENL